MILMIAGASHTGKTLLAQKLLERYQYPYLSIDHLKMGLIRSGYTNLTVYNDEELTAYLWPIIREMVKTAIENGQNLIVEGVYIPFDWALSFEEEYLSEIRYLCLIMAEDYIENHFDAIRNHACDIEKRLDDSDLTKQGLKEENQKNLQRCIEENCPYILVDGVYDVLEQAGGILCLT